jgi:hypothetical protein
VGDAAPTNGRPMTSPFLQPAAEATPSPFFALPQGRGNAVNALAMPMGDSDDDDL